MSETRIDRALEADPREEKLPRWVQDELARLRMHLGEARDRIAELTGGNEDTDTIVDTDGDYPQRLKRGATVEFHVGADRFGAPMEIRVRVAQSQRGRTVLDVNASDSLLVVPRVSNSIELEVRER